MKRCHGGRPSVRVEPRQRRFAQGSLLGELPKRELLRDSCPLQALRTRSVVDDRLGAIDLTRKQRRVRKLQAHRCRSPSARAAVQADHAQQDHNEQI
jgi:hypothetical protein